MRAMADWAKTTGIAPRASTPETHRLIEFQSAQSVMEYTVIIDVLTVARHFTMLNPSPPLRLTGLGWDPT